MVHDRLICLMPCMFKISLSLSMEPFLSHHKTTHAYILSLNRIITLLKYDFVVSCPSLCSYVFGTLSWHTIFGRS